MQALRSLDWLMIGEDAARPRCVQASKHTVSIAPRMMAAVTGSILAIVGSAGRFSASLWFSAKDMANPFSFPGMGRMEVFQNRLSGVSIEAAARSTFCRPTPGHRGLRLLAVGPGHAPFRRIVHI